MISVTEDVLRVGETEAEVVVDIRSALEGQGPVEDDVLTDPHQVLLTPRPQLQTQLEVGPGHDLPGEMRDLQQGEVPALRHAAHPSQDLLGHRGRDRLLLRPDGLRGSVTSEDRVASTSYRGWRGHGVTLVADITTTEGVFLHDTVLSPGRREESSQGTPGDGAGEVGGSEAGAGLAVGAGEPDDVTQGEGLVTKPAPRLLPGRQSCHRSQTSRVFATGGDTGLAGHIRFSYRVGH